MAKFYLKYSPAKSGLTGVEYIAPFISEHFENITFDSIVSDGMLHYGVLVGSGDEITKAFLTLESKFSIMKLTEQEFIGACYLYYNYEEIPGMPIPLTFAQFMFEMEINVDDVIILESVKSFKKLLFKEAAKKQFPPDNDSIADLAKCMTLFNHHYATLTPEQLVEVDNATLMLKAIYDADQCVTAYTTLVANLNSIAVGYYTVKTQVDDALTVEDVQAIVYPS